MKCVNLQREKRKFFKLNKTNLSCLRQFVFVKYHTDIQGGDVEITQGLIRILLQVVN